MSTDDYSRVLNIVGLAANLVGVIILFRWGMPFRVKTGGATFLLADAPTNPQAVALERIYEICGYTGLFLLILGTVLQLIAALMPPTRLPEK